MKRLLAWIVIGLALTVSAASSAKTSGVTIPTGSGSSKDDQTLTVWAGALIGDPVYVTTSGAAGNMDMSLGLDAPLETWNVVADIKDVEVDTSGVLVALIVDASNGQDQMRLTLDDLSFIRDQSEKSAVFVILARTAEEFNAMEPYYAAEAGEAQGLLASGAFARGTSRDEIDLDADEIVGMPLYGGTRSETDQGLFDLRDAPQNWKNLGEIREVVAQDTTGVARFVIDSKGASGSAKAERELPGDEVEFVRNRQGDVFAIFTGPRDRFSESPKPVEDGSD